MALSAETLSNAVLETSFWTAAYRAEVAANCLDYFALVVPGAVEAEILALQIGAPRREYPYVTLFRQLRPRMLAPPAGVPPPLPLFGRGEAEAIVLAEHLGAILLINEHRAAAFARSRGIGVLTVPELIVALRIADVISDRAARRKLDIIAPITSRAIVERARKALATIDSGWQLSGEK